MSAYSHLPLNALRAFEAAARHQSFLKAAEELAVTPGAVSRQVKALEIELGLRLFERLNRAVRLTEDGARLAGEVGRALALMSAAVAEVRTGGAGPLVVSVMHSFAARWLVPRLHRFHELYPDIQVMISASDLAVDLLRDRVDIAIRYGAGPYPGFSATRLISLQMFPVCSPRLLAATPLADPRDLAPTLLLADINLGPGEPSWREWFLAAGHPEMDDSRAHQFSNTYLSLAAALAGRGVALAERALVVDDLAEGRLVKPFEISVRSPNSQWFLTLPEKADQPAIRRFRNWLIAEAERDGLRDS